MPLTFLCTPPFPGLNLSIDGSPIAIVDTSRSVYNEKTDKTNPTGAIAIATVLWNWHPNALRTFLEFIIRDNWNEAEKFTLHTIDRDNYMVTFDYINQDLEWRHRCDYEMPKEGRWTPLYGSDGFSDSHKASWVHSMSNMWALGQMYHARSKPAENRFIGLQFADSEMDPASLC